MPMGENEEQWASEMLAGAGGPTYGVELDDDDESDGDVGDSRG